MCELSHHHLKFWQSCGAAPRLLLLCRFNWLFMLVALATSVVHGAQTPQADSKLEKHYQQVLYAYFQDDLAGALLQFSLLEHFYPGGLQQLPDGLFLHNSEPELLKGSISLAYGLEDQAAHIFKRLLENHAAPEQRTVAWFSLGQTYYQQGQWQKAAQAFSHIDSSEAQTYLDISAQDQLIYLRAQLHQQHGLGTQAEDWSQGLSADSIYHYYLQYNLALENLQLGKTDQAISQLTQLVSAPAEGLQQFLPQWLQPFADADSQQLYNTRQQEILAIQDRVNLTLAYTLLQQGKAHEAYAVFARIRRQGLDGDAALLGYGWAAAKGNELQLALGIWQSLMALPEHTEYSLEAYLAAAYVYEKGFAPGQSVATLQQGLQRFKQVLSELSQARQHIKNSAFIGALAHHFAPASPSVDLPDIQHGVTDNTTALLAGLVQSAGMSQAFRQQLASLQQTQRIALQLHDWQQRLVHYSLMLDERQAERVARAQNMLQARIFDQLSDLQSRRDSLAAQLATAVQQHDGSILMPRVYQQSLARLKGAQQRLSAINQHKNTLQQPLLKADYQQRLLRLQGILGWQASEAMAANGWQAQKALQQLDSEISQTALQQSRLLRLLDARPDYAHQRQRVAQLAASVDSQLLNTAALQQQLLSQLSAQLNHKITQFKGKVDDYVVQAQLALVRLNDQALQQNQQDTGVKPADIGRPPALIPPAGQQP